MHDTRCHINASVTQLKLPDWNANAMQLYAHMHMQVLGSYCVTQLQLSGVAVSALAHMYTEYLYVLDCGWVGCTCMERGRPRTVLTLAQMYSCTNVLLCKCILNISTVLTLAQMYSCTNEHWTFLLDWTTLQLAEWAAIAWRGVSLVQNRMVCNWGSCYWVSSIANKIHMGGNLLTVHSLILVSYFLYFWAPFFGNL